MQDTLKNIKLSICIPTYNRAQFLKQALASVISQADERVEIVVVDGASPDNTTEVVSAYKQSFQNLVYCRGEKNLGVDRDMARCIELAHGEYCWMLSDDDMLEPGAIKRIMVEIESKYEIYLCNVTACDLSMRPLRERQWLSSRTCDRVFNLHDDREFIEYCNKASSIGAFFSYMSAVILRRDTWSREGYNYDFDGSAYALVASLISFTGQKCRLKYIRSPLVLWRNDNASFQFEGGLIKRFSLDFDGYWRLADKFLSENKKVRDAFLRVMTREHPWYTIIHVASFIDSPKLWEQFKAKLLKFGYSSRMAEVCYYLSRYKYIVYLGVRIKRKIIKSHWVNRAFGFFK